MSGLIPNTLAWTSSPFEPALADEVQRLIDRLDSAQRLWLSGYIAGSLGATAQPAAAPAVAGPPLVTVLYGSHSGNCEQLAAQIGAALAQRGVAHVTLDMLDCRKNHLQEARNLLVVVSTHGEGDPPEHALPLHELLHSRKAPRLDHLKYSVLALGDSSYEKFCETGRQFDARLQALGAQPLHARTECDVDFSEPAQQWIDAVVGQLAQAHGAQAQPAAAPARALASVSNAYTRKNPFHAPVLANQRLTAQGSSKDVRHVELSLEGSNIHYEPGDSLGIVPRNVESEVDTLLAALHYDAERAVTVSGQEMPLRQALIEHLDIGPVTRALVERYAAAVPATALDGLLEAGNEAQLEDYVHGRHLLDLVLDHPPKGLDAGAFAQTLRPLAPRLYSIASSLRATPDEAHLTIGLVQYQSLGRDHRGVVSGWVAALTGEDANAPVYLQRNPAFRLPAQQDAPVIMIGPGTGVAPFRGFMAEREASGATGRNWLFFGDRSFQTDFLYQAEWLEWRKRGLLQRIDVAFSRDSTPKTYVQHRMREQGRDLYAWLQEGAHLYVCGDAGSMAPDVDRALREVIAQHGALSTDQVDEYVLQLQRERRYQKDVY